MTYSSEYPPMSVNEYESAPWNEKDVEREKVNVTVTHSFDFDHTLEIDEGEDDCYVLYREYQKQYPSLEDIFNYLKDHFSNPKNDTEKLIKHISENAVITDHFIDFAL